MKPPSRRDSRLASCATGIDVGLGPSPVFGVQDNAGIPENAGNAGNALYKSHGVERRQHERIQTPAPKKRGKHVFGFKGVWSGVIVHVSIPQEGS